MSRMGGGVVIRDRFEMLKSSGSSSLRAIDPRRGREGERLTQDRAAKIGPPIIQAESGKSIGDSVDSRRGT